MDHRFRYKPIIIVYIAHHQDSYIHPSLLFVLTYITIDTIWKFSCRFIGLPINGYLTGLYATHKQMKPLYRYRYRMINKIHEACVVRYKCYFNISFVKNSFVIRIKQSVWIKSLKCHSFIAEYTMVKCF